MAKIISFCTACQLSKKFRHKNKTVLFISGYFDLLHLGHIELFKKTKLFKKGGVLFVGIDTDEHLTLAKGQTRPIFTQQIKAKIFAAISYVDYVVILSKKYYQNFVDSYKQINPDFVICGNTEKIVLNRIRKDALKAGCKFKYLGHRRKLDSTSQIADRILKYFPS